MPIIGKTIDELPSFSGTPSLGSYMVIRDMTLPSTDTEATKKFTISDFLLLFQLAQNMYIGKIVLAEGNQTVTLPVAFSLVPEVGILRVEDMSGVQIGGVVNISGVTETTFIADATEACVLTYMVGNQTTQPVNNPLAWLAAAEDDVLQYKSGQWTNRTMAELLIDLNIEPATKESIGLGNVDNTSDVNKPISTATQSALNDKQPIDSDLTTIAGLTPSDDDVLQRKSGAWTNRTLAQLKNDLAIPQLLTFGNSTTLASGATEFIAINNQVVATGTMRFYFRESGTLRNLTVWAGTSSSLNVTFTIMRGVGTGASSATSLTKSVTPAVNGTYQSFSDTSNTVSISAGDWIEVRVANSASGFGAIGIGGSVEFIPTF